MQSCPSHKPPTVGPWLVLIVGSRPWRCTAVADLVRSLGCDCVTSASAAASVVELLRRRRQGRPVDVVVADDDVQDEAALTEVLQRTATHAVPLNEVLRERVLRSMRRRDGLRVLVVEDEPVNRLIISAILQARGVSVAVVGSGEEALASLAADPFDLVLMDVELPGLSGPDTTAVIRGATRTDIFEPTIPILAITAHEGGLADEWRRVGMDGWVAKPVDPEELMRAIDTCVDR